MDILGRKIQLYQGLLSTMPSDLAEGEPCVAFDDVTGLPQLFVGTASGNKRIQAEQWIIDDLISTEKGASLSANQGRLLKEMIDAIGAGGSSVNVIDNLLSNSPVSALSARQGKVVNEKIISHENNQTDEKHIELVEVEPVDLTNTGVVFLRRDENTGTVPGQPTLDELKQEVRKLEQDLEQHEKKIASDTELGHIKVDGTTINVDPITGVASAQEQGYQLTNGVINKTPPSNDYNDVVEPGMYTMPDVGALNSPGQLSANGKYNPSLLVMVSDNGDGTNTISQLVIGYSGTMFTRTNTVSISNNWWAWIMVPKGLNNTLTSTSTTEASTANAVKQVNDKLTSSWIGDSTVILPFQQAHTGAVRYRKALTTVEVIVDLSVVLTALTANIEYTMFTLASGYRPSEACVGNALVFASTGNIVVPIIVNPIGTVVFKSTVTTPIGSIIRCQLTFATGESLN